MEQIPVPSFIVKFAKNRLGDENLPSSFKVFRQDGMFIFGYRNLHLAVKNYHKDNKSLLILGTPICGEKIDYDMASRIILNNDLSDTALSTINGSYLFILYEKTNGVFRATVINDRFASIPFYYRAGSDGLTGALTYLDACRFSADTRRPIAKEAVFEFFCLKQLMGDKTYDEQAKYLTPSSVLTYDGNSLSCRRYWEPRYKAGKISLNEFTYRFIDTLKASLRRRCAQDKRYGLFLSGGLDSRLILAAIDGLAACFTIGDLPNQEVRTASAVAGIKNCEHIFLKRDIDFYHSIIPYAVLIGGGMYAFAEAHFMNYKEIADSGIDTMIHGCFLDSLFQGSYLPKKPRRFAGVPTSFYRILKVRDSLVQAFLSNIKYRIKSMNPLFLIKAGLRDNMSNALQSSIAQLAGEGAKFCEDQYQLWEYICFHNISRYWSFLNILSMRVDVAEFSPALDNDLFDLYLSMPLEYKLYAKVPKKALSILNPQMARVINANSGHRITNNPLSDTMASLGNKAVSRLLRGRRNDECRNPIFTERSWLNYGEYIRQVEPMRRIAEGLKTSELLDSAGIFEMDEVRRVIDAHLNGKGNFTDVIIRITTIEQLLKFVAQPLEMDKWSS